jgi:hypothetical protein
MNDRPRERARIAEEENRNLCLELATLRAKYEAVMMIAALSTIEAGDKTPREWLEMAVSYVRKYESKTLTEGDKQTPA